MDILQTAYEKVTARHPGLAFERYEVIKLVHDYRMYWKPRLVRTILLAESHVFTSDEEIRIRHTLSLPDYPSHYVRFVYNLAYGENHILTKPVTKNSGTPQYWRLFNEIAGGGYRVINNPNQADKLDQKIALLRHLQQQGVWLLDCSIVGLYQDGVKPSVNQMNDILTTSFRHYCQPLILQEHPANIVVIGKGIYQLLQSELRFTGVATDWIHQPNARLSAGQRRDIGKVGIFAP